MITFGKMLKSRFERRHQNLGPLKTQDVASTLQLKRGKGYGPQPSSGQPIVEARQERLLWSQVPPPSPKNKIKYFHYPFQNINLKNPIQLENYFANGE